MMEVLTTIKDFLWNYILLFALIGIGVYMSIKLRFPQIKRLFPNIGKLIRDIRNKVPAQEGRMTPFQSLATAVAAQVGTGNIVGVATAIAAGGPGAAFWMILSAFFGMSTIFSEAVLAQYYREERDGHYVGGPAYYIRKGLKSKWLSITFAILTVIALGIVGLMVQSNSIVISLNDSFQLSKTWITIGLAAIVGVILTGGMQRIAGFSEKVVPVMAFAYILGSIIIVFMNIGDFLPALKMIVVGAFAPQAIGGGVLGITIQSAIQFGLSRGLFSNEAGMGSTPHSHAVASTDHPAEQGFIAMIGVFVSTFLICVATVMVNLTSGSYNPAISAKEMQSQATLMTQRGFESGFGTFGGAFLSISLASFALTTIIGWYFFAESNIIMLAGKKRSIVGMFRIVAIGFLVVGTLLDADIIWTLSDIFTGLMALPNIVALLFLSGTAKKILDHYDKCKKENQLKWPTEDDLK